MLWIALAIGAVLGLSVYLVIRFIRWATDTSSLGRGRIQDSGASRRAVDAESEGARRAASLQMVDAIRLEMGELRTDVVWSITNSALWDMAVPASKHFFTALTVWEDHHRTWGAEEVVHAAAELKVLWTAAIDTATRLGINHLSSVDRPKADTAIKLARKAASTTSDAERHQLMAKAAEVLSGIISITIPHETMRKIERGSAPLALPEAQELHDESPPAPPEVT